MVVTHLLKLGILEAYLSTERTFLMKCRHHGQKELHFHVFFAKNHWKGCRTRIRSTYIVKSQLILSHIQRLRFFKVSSATLQIFN